MAEVKNKKKIYNSNYLNNIFYSFFMLQFLC